jgi:uncharacterized protein YjiK
MKYIIIILVIALVSAGYVYRDDLGTTLLASENKKEKKDKDKKSNKKAPASEGVKVVHQWQLPDRLKEISGLSYIDAERFACVQDEEGVMFIYNIQSQQIEKEIPFGNAGDYEGIALAGSTAYIVRSDGTLFEISNWNGKPSTKQYSTALTEKHNVEALVYDKTGNRLLLGIKDNEPSTKAYKGVYAFDLGAKSFSNDPVYKIDMNQAEAGGKKNKGFKPSAIAVHPSTNDLFVVDGPASRLMVMSRDGAVKQMINLGAAFEQPEGITFSPEGEIFISNEGVNSSGNITRIQVN